jgi:hypothetical protein
LKVHFLQQLQCFLSNLHSIPVHTFMFRNLITTSMQHFTFDM